MQCITVALCCGFLATIVAGQNTQPRFTNDVEVINFLQGKFIQENYYSFTEPVATLTCVDPDPGQSLLYRATGTNAVRINQRTGDVTIVRPLNRETQNDDPIVVTFFCQDYDELGIPVSTEPADMTAEVLVQDINDNRPQFSVSAAEGYTLTISESAEPGTLLTPLLSVTDDDIAQNSRLQRVDFQCGDTEETQEGCRLFRAEFEKTGEQTNNVRIFLRDRLDYENRTFYKMGLEAVDGPGNPLPIQFTTSVGVLIEVEDSQDTPPSFTNTNLNFDIFEGTQAGTMVEFALSARDGDIGNPRAIFLEILPNQNGQPDLFEAGQTVAPLDPRTGVYTAGVRVAQDIDRETQGNSASFTAKATELESNGTLTNDFTTLQFTARILDINDNSPLFSNDTYRVTVQELDGSSGVVQIPNLRIDVTDRDETSYAQYVVEVSSQSTPGAFGLTPDGQVSGETSFYLTVNTFDNFDYDRPEFRTQTARLTATEILPGGGRGTRSSTATVTVSLTDLNDNSPEFQQREYTASIAETAATGTSILTILATDKDEGLNAELEYSISSSAQNKFAINAATGELTLAGALDYETQTEYSFLVFAQDKSANPLTSQVQVSISVNNVNDIGPQFTLPVYTATVRENSLTFESDVIVEALDPTDLDDQITYRIVSGNTPTNSFVLDRTSGRLSLREQLDYEQTPNNSGFYTLIVEASDNGQPPLTANTRITVSVLDENDFSPRFNPRSYSQTISEAEPAGRSLLQVTAADGDLGSNGQLTYRIISGARDNFAIDRSGTFSISNSPTFDYDRFKFYTVQIGAFDGGSPQLSDNATVLITVTDANNKPPSFDRDLYTKVVEDTTPIGNSILQMTATDPDVVAGYRLQYTIDRSSVTALNRGGSQVGSTFEYDFTSVFTINPQTGLISLAKELDRDYVVEIAFTVKVEDVSDNVIPSQQGLQTATAKVTITITGAVNTDLYFNRPWTKDNPIYRQPILESAARGTPIITLQARDPANGDRIIQNYVEVSEPEGGNFFSVSPTGIVTLIADLDYDQGDRVHSVVVRASEGGRSVTATVIVLVEDENDIFPVFTRSLYEFTVSENLRNPYRVGGVSVTDDDTATFGPIEFTLRGQNSEDFILFTSSTGGSSGKSTDILIREELDFETTQEYILDIFATDNARRSGSAIRNQARATVRITVIDENDNGPVFDDESRVFSVAENAPISTRLGQVLARDKDFGVNGRILYSLERATGSGTAGDLPLRLFSVTPFSGIVLTQSDLSGLGGAYNFRLVATDQGSPPNSASIPVTVKVQGAEDDDGTPQWLQPVNNYLADVYENDPGAVVPVTLQASPRTPSADASNPNTVPLYSFSPFPRDYLNFTIHPTNGTIVVKDSLDRELKEIYTLVVVATDRLNSTLFSRRTIRVRLLDRDDNGPLFKQQYAACPTDMEVPTAYSADDNSPAGTVVATASACDPDGPQFSQMEYSIYLDNDICRDLDVDAFRVEPYTGNIVAKRMLDYEERPWYLVCVRVQPRTPNGRKRRQAEHSEAAESESLSRQKRQTMIGGLPEGLDATLMTPNDTVGYFLIMINDLNDQPPVFPVKPLDAVLQSTPTSDFVIQVNATDADGPQHSRVLYRLADTVYHPGDGGRPFTMDTAFAIDPSTGIVTTNMPSYEEFADGYFTVTVIAQDYESAVFSDSVELTIVVYQRSQILRVVLDLEPGEGRAKANEIIQKLNALDSNTKIYYLSASEHRTVDGPVADQADICFVIVREKQAYSASNGIGLLDSQSYAEELGATEYKLVNRGTCYPLRSSADSVKWRDLWWVLVAIAIFLFICCLILLVTICILYDKYRDYMNTQRTYLVPQ